MALLTDLPRPSSSRLAVRLTPDARRQVRSGHPWVYEGSIRSVNREGAAGDLAVVFDDERQFIAIGLWDPASPIRIKVLHTGRPVTIDDNWFVGKFESARKLRQSLIDTAGTPTQTTGYRVVHGENDGLPGLVVDRYGDVLVLKLYTAAWIPHLADIVPALVAVLGQCSIVLRLARSMRDQPLFGLEEGLVLAGDPVTGTVGFDETGLHFEADVVRGQKTGHFLDQRDNRVRVGALAAGRRVLDLFSCTGGFSVHAAAGGAKTVLSVDSSPGALETARRNMALNVSLPNVRACEHQTVAAEAFGELERLGEARRRFDLVIVDPPSFAQNAASVARAITSYERLTTLAIALLEPEGILVQASCSSRVSDAEFFRAVHTAASRAGTDLEEIERTGHALDHPITFPEGGYLKTMYARPTTPIGRRVPRTLAAALPDEPAPAEAGRSRGRDAAAARPKRTRPTG